MTIIYSLVRPLIMTLPPEMAHAMSIGVLKWGLGRPISKPAKYPSLKTNVFGLDFPSPVGLAAGYDKDGEVPDQLLALGFGFTEVGTITPLRQPGNARPRLYRLIEDRAIINRMGFNSRGIENAILNLVHHKKSVGIIGINVGANKDSEDRVGDYVKGIHALHEFADYFVINISSPNTPGLRQLQGRKALGHLLSKCREALNDVDPSRKIPLLVKVAPDLYADDVADIAETVLEYEMDGLIVSNTTVERAAGLKSRWKDQAGGLSGKPLFGPSTEILWRFYRATGGRIPLIGTGGVASGRDAYLKIRAGASLVQLYSALVYQGPGLPAKINRELAKCLQEDGFTSISEVIGFDHRN
jgi:dihydroorotate dehydrogenase